MTTDGAPPAYGSEGGGGNVAMQPSAPAIMNNNGQKIVYVMQQPPQQPQAQTKVVYVGSDGQPVSAALQRQYEAQAQPQQQPQVIYMNSNNYGQGPGQQSIVQQALAAKLARATAVQTTPAASGAAWQAAPNFTPVHMVHGRRQNQAQCCGAGIKIDDAKRIPSEKPNHCNKVFLWINTLIFAYLWMIFGQFETNQTYATTYCNTTYPDVVKDTSNSYNCTNAGPCNRDDACNVVVTYDSDDDIMCAAYDDYDYYDCQCCGKAVFFAVAIPYYVLLGLNTLRIMVFTLLCGMCWVDRKQNYLVNEKTGKVKLQKFMDYFCDHPASIFICLCYADVRRAMNEGVAYGITLPMTKFLALNIFMQHIPMAVLMGYYVANNGLSGGENMPFVIALIMACVGFLSNVYRWQQTNKIERENMLKSVT